MLLANIAAEADELQVIVSGRAIHMGDNDLNENNFGLGIQYDFNPQQRWIPLINLASFKDSNNQTSRYIGAGIKRRFRLRAAPHTLNFDLGAIGLAMTRPDYNDDRPFYGALPFVSIGNDWGGINAIFVPEIERDSLPFWYFQFSLKLLEF
jgi:hypothetical protein